MNPQAGLWFDEHHIQVDLGFLGIAKDYEPSRLSIPFKRKPHQQLDEEQKAYNKAVSSLRIRVEHAIGGLKRYRFLADRLRCRNIDLYNQVAGVCAGLWNFQLTC